MQQPIIEYINIFETAIVMNIIATKNGIFNWYEYQHRESYNQCGIETKYVTVCWVFCMFLP